jgi:hypothetical protein
MFLAPLTSRCSAKPQEQNQAAYDFGGEGENFGQTRFGSRLLQEKASHNGLVI